MDIIVHRTMREQIRFVKSTGLSMAQFGILMQLHFHNDCPMSYLSSRMNISGAAASQLVDKLVQSGLLERSEDQNDRRVKKLRLSDKGRDLVESNLAARHKVVDGVVSNLTPVEAEKVGEAMEIMTKVFQLMQEKEKNPAI